MVLCNVMQSKGQCHLDHQPQVARIYKTIYTKSILQRERINSNILNSESCFSKILNITIFSGICG